jgi:Glycosyl transferase family 11
MSEISKLKVIARPMGGLGNQLFCYAAARRLALVNQAELVMDTVTGFERDVRFHRKYALDNFKIPARPATAQERLEPLERYRRGLLKWIARNQPFEQRCYITQEKLEFDSRLLAVRLESKHKSIVHFEGYWQSEHYFKDVESTIRQDLEIEPPKDALNLKAAAAIQACHTAGTSVALHVRWFDSPTQFAGHNLSTDYYNRAIAFVEHKLTAPHYFLFSDDPVAAKQKISLPKDRVTFIDHNQGEQHAYADLWLMQQCQNFIIANSTFSWWGAWLNPLSTKIVIAPDIDLTQGVVTSWGFDGLIPADWLLL